METKDILKSLRKSNGYSTMQEFCAAADISFWVESGRLS